MQAVISFLLKVFMILAIFFLMSGAYIAFYEEIEARKMLGINKLAHTIILWICLTGGLALLVQLWIL